MANKIAVITQSISYVDSDGVTRQSSYTTRSPYAAPIDGAHDVPDSQAEDTVYPIPFGSIESATWLEITNKTANGVNAGQDLLISVNGNDDIFQLVPGQAYLLALPAIPDTVPITEASVKTSVAQVGAGQIGYRLGGDPV